MTWEKKRITIVTKAYPEPSKKHGDVACTAGITEDGEWIRIYPIDVRHFIGASRIPKWSVIECEVEKDNDYLNRKESHKVRPDSIRVIDDSKMKSKSRVDWARRNSILLPKLMPTIESLQAEFEKDRTSLGVIKPAQIHEMLKTDDLQIYGKESSWSYSLTFDGERIPNITKIPHIFQYRFSCTSKGDCEHKMQCEDWELFEFYRKHGVRYGTPELLWEKLHHRFFIHMLEKCNLHFIVGTHSQFPTWFIIGIYYPTKEKSS